MTEPTIPWRDGLSEFLPAPKKVQSIIRDVIGAHEFYNDSYCICDHGVTEYTPQEHADHLTDQIMQALTKEGTP